MRKVIWKALAIILISFVIAIYLWPKMPERMASHWDSQARVNGTISRFWGLFLMPIVSVAMLLLFLALPYLDPLRKNIQKFMKYFDMFILAIIAFMFYLYVLTILWNLNYRFNMIYMILPAFAVLFYIAGVLVQNAKRNWFIGIRTPWTLSSDLVWQKTHRLGAVLFKIVAIFSLLALFFPTKAFWIFFITIIIAAIVPILYSYFEYRKLKK